MKKIMKEIVDQIEKRVNTYTEEGSIKTYHVRIDVDDDDIEVTPLNGTTLYCIDALVLIGKYWGVSYYVTTVGSTLKFRYYGIKD